MGKIFEVSLEGKESMRLEKFRKRFRFFYHPIRKVWYATERAVALARTKGFAPTVLREFDADQAGVKIIDSFPASLTSPPTGTARDEIIGCALAGEQNGQIPIPIYLGRDVDIRQHPGAFVLDMAGGRRNYVWRFPMVNENISNLSILDRFPRLVSAIKDPDTKVVFSLGGGGLKAFAHNVLFRLFESLGLRSYVDELWGTSAGAIAALWYACNVPPEEMDQSGYDLYNDRYSLLLSPSKLRVLGNLVAEHILPPKFRGSGFGGFLDSAKSIHDFILRVKKYRQPTIPFFCVAFNLNEFRPEVLTPLIFDIPEYRDLIYTCDPIEAAIASSSVPVLFVPKVIRRSNKEVTYIDGMTTEMVPMISIYKKWQIDRRIGLEKRSKLFILAAKVATNSLYQPQETKNISELAMMLIYHDAMHNAMVESQRTTICRDANVKLLEVAVPLSEYSNFDIYHIPLFLKSSYIHYINDLLDFEKTGEMAPKR
jgi:Patatin-like phospholipase